MQAPIRGWLLMANPAANKRPGARWAGVLDVLDERICKRCKIIWTCGQNDRREREKAGEKEHGPAGSRYRAPFGFCSWRVGSREIANCIRPDWEPTGIWRRAWQRLWPSGAGEAVGGPRPRAARPWGRLAARPL